MDWSAILKVIKYNAYSYSFPGHYAFCQKHFKTASNITLNDLKMLVRV